MKKIVVLLLFVFLATDDYAQTFSNPILGGDHPDPTIVRVGNDYYLTHSSFEYLPGLTVYHSRDLVNWEPLCSALYDKLGSVWAPDISEYKGQYYIYFTVSQGNDDFSTWVVTARNPAGPWSRPKNLHIDKWIDPCHVVDDKTGQRWLFLSGGHRIKLAEDGLSTIGTIEKVYDGWEIPKNWIVEGTALEGPKIKRIGQYYYWLNAEGGTAGPATTHMAIVARSESLNGPWENSPYNPLIHTYSSTEAWWSKGHASLIDTPDGRWYAIFHAYRGNRLNQGRQTLLEPVVLTEDKWLRAPVDLNVDKPIPSPFGTIQISEKNENLPLFRLGLEWRLHGNYTPSRYHLQGNSLKVKGDSSHVFDGSPLLFVAPDPDYEISAEFELESNTEAGLTLYYNDKLFTGFGASKEKKNCWRRGERRGKGMNPYGNHFWIKLRFKDNVVTGYISNDGNNWNMEHWGMEVSGYDHNTLGGFMSLLPGIYCYGEGSATISNFKYVAIR
jgi:xylan 1,4-beta-xylosidase